MVSVPAAGERPNEFSARILRQRPARRPSPCSPAFLPRADLGDPSQWHPRNLCFISGPGRGVPAAVCAWPRVAGICEGPWGNGGPFGLAQGLGRPLVAAGLRPIPVGCSRRDLRA